MGNRVIEASLLGIMVTTQTAAEQQHFLDVAGEYTV
jgi:hypothetical protein